MRIINKKPMPTGLDVTVGSKKDAEYLAEEAEKVGFAKGLIKQTPGTKGTPVYHVFIRTKPGSCVAEIEGFVNKHQG